MSKITIDQYELLASCVVKNLKIAEDNLDKLWTMLNADDDYKDGTCYDDLMTKIELFGDRINEFIDDVYNEVGLTVDKDGLDNDRG